MSIYEIWGSKDFLDKNDKNNVFCWKGIKWILIVVYILVKY